MSEEEIKGKYKMYQAFYEMMEEWVVRDYYNPSIKAEVVLDTMLSEFVCEFLQYYRKEHTFTLLAKEFPVKPVDYKGKNLNFPKLDYLVKDEEDNLYFLELKTTSDSFDDVQYERYKAYAELDGDKAKIIELWDAYEKILIENGIKEKREAIIGKKRYYNIVKRSKKYVYQVCDLKKAGVLDFPSDKNTMKIKKDYKKIYLVYLTIDLIGGAENIPELSDKEPMPDISQIVLSSLIKKDDSENDFQNSLKDTQKKKKWQAVQTILEKIIASNAKLRDDSDSNPQ